MTHAVARLRAERIARSAKPFLARGSRSVRCPDCRLAVTHCLCAWRPRIAAQSAVCLLMHDVEALKPSNTGWLIADVLADTSAFGWSRVVVDAALPVLLNDPQWQPYLVFPGEYVAAERVVSEVQPAPGKRPLFVLLDATWSEARKMFRKAPISIVCRCSACRPNNCHATSCGAPSAMITSAPPRWRRCAWSWLAISARPMA